MLSIQDGSVLQPRTLRDHFEHFDERLEVWVESSGDHVFVDSNIGPPGMIAGLDSAGFLRNFDTKNLAVTFRGDAYSLQPIVTAIEELHARALQLSRQVP